MPIPNVGIKLAGSAELLKSLWVSSQPSPPVVLWQFIAAQLFWWSHVLHLASATATSVIFLNLLEQNDLSPYCWDFMEMPPVLPRSA